MSTFYLTVGVAASGKTTWAFGNANIQDAVLDSDAIREEICGNWADQSKNTEVFEIMKQRAFQAMRECRNVYYVATNLNLKRRIALLQYLKKYFPSYKYVVRVFVYSIDTLFARNDARAHHVSAYVIQKQMLQMQLPVVNEGWNEIQIEVEGTQEEQRNYYKKITHDVVWFGDQRNPHHSLPLHIHMNYCVDQVPRDGILDYAAAWHDVGKVYTQSIDENGIAHYYGHAEYGAQLTLLCGLPYEVALLVNYHMLGYESEKAQAAWRQRLGDELWEQLMILHRADEAAH